MQEKDYTVIYGAKRGNSFFWKLSFPLNLSKICEWRHCRASPAFSRRVISQKLTTQREIRFYRITAIHARHQDHCFRMILSVRLPSSSKYLEGQIISGDIPSASAISFSPRGHGRVSAFASVLEDSPAIRDCAAREVLFFLSAAIMSAGCQSGCIMPSPRQSTSRHQRCVSSAEH